MGEISDERFKRELEWERLSLEHNEDNRRALFGLPPRYSIVEEFIKGAKARVYDSLEETFKKYRQLCEAIAKNGERSTA